MPARRTNAPQLYLFSGTYRHWPGLSRPSWAQDKPADKPAASPAAPTSGARAEFLDRLDFYEQRFVSLAQAVPAEKYTWRPGEGVRSISEVYLHVAAANFNLPHLIGTEPPAGFEVRGFEKSTTDKAKIIQTMKDSFAHYRSAVLGLSDADVEKTVKLFGKDRTYRYVFLFCTGHLGRAPGPIDRLRAKQWHSAAVDGRAAATTETSSKTEVIEVTFATFRNRHSGAL